MDPLGGLRSDISQAKKVGKNVETQVKRGKNMQKKAASLNKDVLRHLLLYFLIGILLSCAVFIPVYKGSTFPVVQSFAWTGVIIAFLLGLWSFNRAQRKIDWFESGEGWAAFGFTLLTTLTLFLGFIGGWFLMSGLLVRNVLSPAVVILVGSSFVVFTVPHLLYITYLKAMSIPERVYKFWSFPSRPLDYDPGWNADRIIFANLTFVKDMNDPVSLTTVKARLPLEAPLGQLLHLFLLDYNENRSPDAPVKQIRSTKGDLGWVFYSKRFLGIRKYFDPDVTIEQNKIKEDVTIYLDRRIISE